VKLFHRLRRHFKIDRAPRAWNSPSKVRRRFARSIIAVLLIFSIGGHWALLQSVAWVSMVIDYSKDAPISIAVEKTFDGKHPCNICTLVQRGKQTEEKREAIKTKHKLDLWVAFAETSLPNLALVRADFVPVISFFHGRGDSPPVPPPRFA
jgi:hypothetical protein